MKTRNTRFTKKRMTVSKALIIFFIITTLTLIIAISISNYIQVSTAIKKERQELSVHAVNEIQQAIKTFVNYRIRTLRDYAQFPLLTQGVMQPEISQENLADFFDNLSILSSRTFFTLLDYKGLPIYSTHKDTIFEQERDKIAQHLIKNNESEYWDIYKDESRGHWIFAVPVFYNGLKEGIFIGEIPINDFETDQNISTLMGHHRLDIVIDSGIIFSSGPDLKTPHEIFPIENSDVTIHFSWGYDDADWKQKVSLVYLSSIIIMVIGICSFSALFLLIKKYISLPLKMFRENALQLAKNYSGVRLNKDFFLEEIAHSAHSFNDMADQIQNRVAELQDLKNGLELEVKQRTLEIRQEQKNLEKIINTAPTGMLLLDETANVRLVNQTMIEQLNLNLKQASSLNVGDILNCPKTVDTLTRCGQSAVCTDCPINMALENALKTKTDARGIEFKQTITRDHQKLTLHFLIRGTHLIMKGKTHSLLTFANITDQKKAENELSKERQRLAGILRGTNAGTWEWNIQSDETTFNHRWADIIGYTLEEISPVSIKTWKEFTHPDDLEKSSHLLEKHFAGRLDYYECEARMKHKNGSWIWVLDRGKVVSWTKDKKPLMMMGTHQDITKTKSIQTALKTSKDEAEAANRAKSEFLANMSHEIRTPLNAVLGFSDLLSSIVTNSRQKNYLSSIHAAGKSLLTIINDILDLSKIEAGLLKMEYDYIDIKDVINDIILIFSHTCHEKKLKTVVDIDKRMPTGLFIDEIRLRQVLLNLVGNAVKFTESGQIKIGVSAKPKPGEKTFNLEIKVSDTGIGIPENQQKTIFDAFSQQDGQSTRKFGGTGLGLTITRRLVDLMNGRIDLRSHINQGTEFTITLHGIKASDVQPDDIDSSPINNLNNINFNKALIMVIDDIESNRTLIREQLMDTGLQIRDAENGHLALEMIDKIKPDLILTDIRMPDLDGFAILNKIKSNPNTSHIPVIAITASISTEKEDTRSLQFDSLLLKPISKKLLLQEISNFIPFASQNPAPDIINDHTPKLDIQHASKLLKELNNNFIPQIDHFGGALEMDSIKRFATQLSELGHKYNTDYIMQYAMQLENSVDTFDITSIQDLINSFPDIISTIQRADNEK